MPIYEFYCEDCHTVYSFFSRRVNTTVRPDCPRCDRREPVRQASVFGLPRIREGQPEGVPAGLDEAGLERAMALMTDEFTNLDEGDPGRAATMMRRLLDASGLKAGGSMDEAIQRLEAGEGPEQIEVELGGALENGELFQTTRRRLLEGIRRKHLPPKFDSTLYELDT